MREIRFAADVRRVGGVLHEKVTIDFAGGLKTVDLWRAGVGGQLKIIQDQEKKLILK